LGAAERAPANIGGRRGKAACPFLLVLHRLPYKGKGEGGADEEGGGEGIRVHIIHSSEGCVEEKRRGKRGHPEYAVIARRGGRKRRRRGGRERRGIGGIGLSPL